MSYTIEQIVKNVAKWKASAGKTRYLKYLHGEKLTLKQSIVAKCAECRNGFDDGLGTDCGIRACPLYPFSPWSLAPAAKRAVKGPSFPVRIENKPSGATEGAKPVAEEV